MLILQGGEARRLLEGRELKVLSAVEGAYRAHAEGRTVVPHSLFLRLPTQPSNRIIALPSYLGGEAAVAGIKWVSSFPGNLARGLDRASAVIVLNSVSTGRPEAFLEASAISAARTAASAALAASRLLPDIEERDAALIGCGPINFQIARYLVATRPGLRVLHAHDLEPARAHLFRQRCLDALPQVSVEIATRRQEALDHRLVSIATTANRPYLEELEMLPPGAAVLHISLRDLTPQAILQCDNVTDDVDHVCRADTSLHLAEQLAGNRHFIRCTLGEILLGSAPARGCERVAVFSPFGLGVLDLAVADLLRAVAMEEGVGLVLDEFLPTGWGQD